jgi:predicted ATPase/DNA-binding CsgD family transcriptional regulator
VVGIESPATLPTCSHPPGWQGLKRMPEVSSGNRRPQSERAAWPGVPRGSLPRPLTSFIGRERELTQAKRLLRDSYLVTLTGPGGSGKTRLCIAVAAEVAADYPDGVYFVPLAPVRDPSLVPSTIAQGIGLQDARDRPLMEHLLSQLRGRQMLLVLDNFEHLLPGAAVVTELLSATSALRILVSSRSSLHVSGEQECSVPPLAVPDLQTRPTPESLADCESVHLFAERAAATVPGFTLTEENAPVIAEIARRLDGLPLAIELAAARVKLLPPEAILPRLEHSLGLLSGGSRDLPDRQQTLRGTIAWSDDLLTQGARRLLAACSVFAGGASLEAIETVCGPGTESGRPVLDGVAELVDQSLLRQVRSSAPSLPRYAMLETVREYAAERLDHLPEADWVRGAHAAFFLALVETGRPRTGGLATREWLERVDAEHNNIRAALTWYRDHDPPTALRLAASMAAFWSLRGHHTEGRQRLVELLALISRASVIRVSALNGAGWLALDQGDYAEASSLFAESIGLAQALGDTVGEGIATVYLGRCKLSSLQIAEAVPDVQRATALLSHAGDRPAMALTIFYSALAALLTGRLEAACDLFARCAADAAGLGLEPLTARARAMLSYPLLDLGNMAAARGALAEGIPLAADVGDRWFVQIGLGACIGLAAGTGRPRLALRLAGVADAYRDANEFSLPVPIAETIDRWLRQARASAGAVAGRLNAEGRLLSPEQAVQLALADEPKEARGPGPRRTLTRREAEVAARVARGLTNREIAAQLFLSVRTVEVHVDHILTKLGFHTRTQLAAWAHEEGLLPESAGNT